MNTDEKRIEHTRIQRGRDMRSGPLPPPPEIKKAIVFLAILDRIP